MRPGEVRLLIRGNKSAILRFVRALAVGSLASGFVVLVAHFSAYNDGGPLAELKAYEPNVALSLVLFISGLFVAVVSRSVAAMQPRDQPVDVDAVVDWVQTFEDQKTLPGIERRNGAMAEASHTQPPQQDSLPVRILPRPSQEF